MFLLIQVLEHRNETEPHYDTIHVLGDQFYTLDDIETYVDDRVTSTQLDKHEMFVLDTNTHRTYDIASDDDGLTLYLRPVTPRSTAATQPHD